MLYNVVAVPGALARYRGSAPLRSTLASRLLLGALIRAYQVPGGTIFRVLIAVFLARWAPPCPAEEDAREAAVRIRQTSSAGVASLRCQGGVGVVRVWHVACYS